MKDFSNYHRIDVGKKIEHDSLFLLQRSLDGYSAYEVTINDTKTAKVLMNQKWDADGEAMKIIGHIQDIERGNLVVYNNETWLVTTKPEDNRIYRKAQINLCTTAFPIVEEGRQIQTGTDSRGRPIYRYEEGRKDLIPCVVKFNDASTSIADTNKPANLLDNQIVVTIPYMESPAIEYNEEFELYKDKYRIIRINPSDSINGVGVLHITGERVESVGDD